MTWLYVPPSMCSASAPASAGSSSASELPNPERAASCTWRGKPQPPRAWSRAWKRGGFIRLLSGLTQEPSTLDRGVASWIASLQEIRANPIASLASAAARATTAGSSTSFSASSTSAGLRVSSARTSQGTPAGSSKPSSRHWSGWATALRAEYSQRPRSVPATDASASSSWPTATVGDGAQTANATAGRSDPNSSHHSGVTLTDAFRMWPTPRTITGGAESADRKQELGRTESGGGDLQAAALAASWPTPATDSFRSRGGDRKDEMGLDQQARHWPTPSAGNFNDGEDLGSFDARKARQKAKGINGNGMGDTLAIAAQRLSTEWPTPNTWDAESNGTSHRKATLDAAKRGSRRSVSLHHEVALWPTPMTRDHRSGYLRKSDEELWGKKGRPLERVATNFQLPRQDRPTPPGWRSPPTTLTFYRRFRATTDSALRSEMRALLRMGIRSRGRGWTRRQPEPFVRPSFRRRLNPTFVEWLMGWPTGLSGFERAETAWCLWLPRMRGLLSQLVSQPPAPQARLL
jgi:hypothetical protein